MTQDPQAMRAEIDARRDVEVEGGDEITPVVVARGHGTRCGAFRGCGQRGTGGFTPRVAPFATRDSSPRGL